MAEQRFIASPPWTCRGKNPTLASVLGILLQVGNLSAWAETSDTGEKSGFACSVSPNVRLDAGINIGVTETADDLNPFVGLIMRF